VIFHELVVESIDLPYVQIWIHCSKGTYIRSFANDLGHVLKVGAHLSFLERLACGEWFRTDNSISVDKLEKMQMGDKIPWIYPLEILNHFYTLTANARMVAEIKHGRDVQVTEEKCLNENFEKNENIYISKENTPKQAKVTDSSHNLVAIGQIIWDDGRNFFKPSKVFI
jgi:Pseudouridine synthase